MKYILLGDPTPLARPRFGRYSVWDSQKSAKVVAGISIRNQHKEQPLYLAPIKVKLIFYFPIPISNRKNKIQPNDPYPHRPDLDNLDKFILDVCNGILYQDDRFITEISSCKKYDIKPRTEIYIWTE